MSEEKNKVTAALLTLSESIEGLYTIIRKDLQFRAEIEQSKIVEDFLPKRMKPTSERFKQFQALLEELENADITPLTQEELAGKSSNNPLENNEPYPEPVNKLKRDAENPPQEYNIEPDEI